MKFVVVTGGTISGLGKGTAISSLGVLLKAFGYQVTVIKIDPYLNIDAGTMSPYEHGEVYVLEDGGECDLDLGNYERFLDVNLTKDHNITTGKIYTSVLSKERSGGYLGKTVQMVPHVTDEVQNWILKVAREDDYRLQGKTMNELIVLIELGGTVGDIESMVYLEALQQLQSKVGASNFCNVHVGFVPTVGNELKTKPCQTSVKTLRAAGLRPDFLFCRSQQQLDTENMEKLSNFCQVPYNHIISLYEVDNTYQVPFLMASQNCAENILRRLDLTWNDAQFDWISMCEKERLPHWRKHVGRSKELLPTLSFSLRGLLDTEHRGFRRGDANILIVGKYIENVDSYLSVVKALQHAALYSEVRLFISWLDASALENTGSDKWEAAQAELAAATGILVPGGFGDRGVEGKIECAIYCMKEKKPYLGICLGLQTAVIAVARERLGWVDAHSEEFQPLSEHSVVVHMPEINPHGNKGGTMRLGKKACVIKDDTLTSRMFPTQREIHERHRHRYEINPAHVPLLEKQGDVVFAGTDVSGERMEIMEMTGHPFFLGTQFHPEFTSRVGRPSPFFTQFLLSSTV